MCAGAECSVARLGGRRRTDTENAQLTEKERIEYARRAGRAPSGVISVVLGDDEDVQWYWTHYPDGRSVVTGYEVIKKAREEGFSFEGAVRELLWPGERNEEGPPSTGERA